MEGAGLEGAGLAGGRLASEGRFEAVVVRSTGSWYELRGADNEIFKARLRGRLRLGGSRSTNPVVVGDRVLCSMDEGGEAWIEEILPRDNYIIRRSPNLSRESHIIAANIDQALVVATLFSPATSFEFIDRFLVTSEAYGIPATILLNKMDLALAAEGGAEAVERFLAVYASAGYRVILGAVGAPATGSATAQVDKLATGMAVGAPAPGMEDKLAPGMDELREFLAGRVTLVAGNSGVGKSTLIKAMLPEGVEVRTGEVSRAHGKGMHTTTFSQMYALAGGGDIIDTPGIKGFGLIDIGSGELYHYFPDLMRVSPDCQYYNCTHTHEPGCAVMRAVDNGAIAPERYVSYLKMLEEDEKYR
jgi:ribosome biogenesis GTPase